MSTPENNDANALVWVFFYGSFMDEDKLRNLGVHPRSSQSARLDGFQIRFQPLANLIPANEQAAYGLLTQLSQAELDLLYQDLHSNSGSSYFPLPVSVSLDDQSLKSALCYLAERSADQVPQADYLDEIMQAARKLDLPAEYIATLNSIANEAA